MSKLTEDLIARSNGLLKIEPEVKDWTGKKYQMFNDGGVEVEVGEFLYGLVKVIKPIHILETGTHLGISASYMGQALKENDTESILVTIEHFTELYEKSQQLFKNLELTEYIMGIQGEVDSFDTASEYDLLFLDTEPEHRFGELVRFFPHLKEGGFVFIHDLPRGFCKDNINPDHPELKDWPFGEVPKKMKEWLKNGELVKWHFETPRSMVGFYKSRKDDYVPNN